MSEIIPAMFLLTVQYMLHVLTDARLRKAVLGMWRTLVTLRDHLMLQYAEITTLGAAIVTSALVSPALRMLIHLVSTLLCARHGNS